MKDKSFLRSKLLRKRLALSDSQAVNLSNKITQKLMNQINWRRINSVNAYQAIKSKKEVDITSLLDSLRQDYPGIHVELAPSKAAESQEIPEDKSYDLVVVPLLGFDHTGNRLGYGGGYYDKFLAKNDCKQIVGLAYSFQEVESLPVEAHDQKLDLIITEKEIIKR